MIFRSRMLLVCLIVIALSAVVLPQTTPQTDGKTASDPPVAIPVSLVSRQDEKYRIGFRDKLNVQVFRHPDLNQAVSVNANGTINLFLLPEPLVAVCKTESELADDIAAAYQKDHLKNPQVKVNATEQLSQSVFVIGAVEKPGPFFLNRKVHLLELIALAGGPSKEAGSRILIARPGSAAGCDLKIPDTDDGVGLFDFRVRDLQEGKQTFIMRPGDIVSVLEADIVFVYGNVNEQGQVTMKQPLTLTQAIASAKGLKPATNRGKVRIIRQKPGSLEREEIVVDLGAIDKQKAQDPYLLPNDIIALSEDRTKSIINAVTKSFTQGLGGILYRGY